MNITWFDTTDSTNRLCGELPLDQTEEWTVVAARSQTAGRGQQGNHWASEPGLNLTFSLLLKPTFLLPARQFGLTHAVALGVADYARQRVEGVSLKWPNDVMVGDRKLSGILIESRLCGGRFAAAVCGIGLNLNQTHFGPEAGRPTSLVLLTGRHYDPEAELELLLTALQRRYETLRQGRTAELEADYLGLLYRRNVAARYRYHDRELTATATGTDDEGHLLLATAEGVQLRCAMKEVEFLFDD